MSTCAFSPNSPSLVVRPRLVRSRAVDLAPRYHGEKPYQQVVTEAFDGPVLRLSRRMKLLEIADDRHIRRGRDLESKHAIRRPGKAGIFARHFAAFAAAYAVMALVWCLVV